MQLACWDGLGTFKIRLASATCYHWHKSVSSRGDTVSAMSDQADFLARVPEGTPQGESRAASGLVGTARTPSLRPNKKTGGKRSRETEKSPSEVAAQGNKVSKSSQNWGSVSTQQSDAFHPGTSSNNGKRKASPKKTRSNALPYKGFRIPQITNTSSNSKGKGIMKAKAAAARNGECVPKKVRNSVRFEGVDDDDAEDDVNNNDEQAADGEDSSPQVPDTEGDTQSFTSAKEFSSSSSLNTGEEEKNDMHDDTGKGAKFSITDEAKVFKISLAKEDLPRQKYIDVPMIVNGVAVRLGVAPEAARDTRGFGTTGNPRNGTLSVIIPPHFWERLNKALSENAE